MVEILSRWVLILLVALLPAISYAHGLSPSRLEAPSGSKLIAYQFTALNNYDQWEEYAVQCFKNDLNHPYECRAIPQTFSIAPKKTRKFKVQIAPDEDGIFLVCTIQTRDVGIVTRVCARFQLGEGKIKK